MHFLSCPGRILKVEDAFGQNSLIKLEENRYLSIHVPSRSFFYVEAGAIGDRTSEKRNIVMFSIGSFCFISKSKTQ